MNPLRTGIRRQKKMVAVALILCLAVGVIVFKLYLDLANLRRQLIAARAQIDAQVALRNGLREALQSQVRPKTGHGAPALTGVESHKLLADLKSAEQKIEFATTYYNEAARTYGDRLREFPYSFLATSLRLQPHEPLEFQFEQEQA